jgi:hypothetical protein
MRYVVKELVHAKVRLHFHETSNCETHSHRVASALVD